MKSQSESFFLPYQRRWICDQSKIKIMEKSRQVGMTWTAAYGLVRRQIANPHRLNSWVSSRDEAQAQLFINDCKAFANILNTATSSLGTNILSDNSRPSCLSLHFANNTFIQSLSSNPDAQAGKRGNRLLDEFALHPNPQLLYSIAHPGITWGGQLEIISTHRGSNNYFNLLIQEITLNNNPKNISLHRVTLQDALDQGLLTKLKQKLPKDDPRQSMDPSQYFDSIRNSCPDNASFLQEFMCQPEDNDSFFLHPSLIQSAEYPTNSPWEFSLSQAATSPNNLFLGVDIGRTHDLTVLWLLENINSTLFTRQLICLHNTPFTTQEKIFNDLLSLPNLRKAAIDQSGLGRQFTENATSSFGQHRILPISFTPQSKESLAYSLRSTFEKNLLRIPQDKFIRADLRSIKRSYTPSGNTRWISSNSLDSHADRFWALALAVHAAANHPPQFNYQSLAQPSNRPF